MSKQTPSELTEERFASEDLAALIVDALLRAGLLRDDATSDAEGEAWRELVALWWVCSKDAPMRVTDVNALCAERQPFEELRGRGNGTERLQQTKLGKALQASRYRESTLATV